MVTTFGIFHLTSPHLIQRGPRLGLTQSSRLGVLPLDIPVFVLALAAGENGDAPSRATPRPRTPATPRYTI